METPSRPSSGTCARQTSAARRSRTSPRSRSRRSRSGTTTAVTPARARPLRARRVGFDERDKTRPGEARIDPGPRSVCGRRPGRALGLLLERSRDRADRAGGGPARAAQVADRRPRRRWWHRSVYERAAERELHARDDRSLAHQRGPPAHRRPERGRRPGPRRPAPRPPIGGRTAHRSRVHHRLRRGRRPRNLEEDRGYIAGGFLRRVESRDDKQGLHRPGVELLMDNRRTSWTPIALVAMATAVLASVLGAGTLAAILFGSAVLAASALSALAARVRWSLVAWRIRSELPDPTGPWLGVIVAAAVLTAGLGISSAIGPGLAGMGLKIGSVGVLPDRSAPPPKPA